MGTSLKYISLLLLLANEVISHEEVKFVAVIYRHGDRTPIDFYPTDPWKNESFWPVKFGELTNTGKMQHFRYGQWLQNRYSDLITNVYDPEVLYVLSTDVDRTLMSAQANLAGMFPPIGNEVWDKNILWQPIPVHTIPEGEDNLLHMTKACPAYEEEKKKFETSQEYENLIKEYSYIMEYLSKYVGFKVKTLEELEYIYNTLFIENLYNLTLPSWVSPVFPEPMTEPACLSFRLMTVTPKMARLKVGPILKEIVTKMSKIHEDIDKDAVKLKMSIYSAHDSTVASILNALGIFDDHCPVYTSSVFLELIYDDVDLVSKVRILYKNSTELIEPAIMLIPGCGEACPLEQFKALYHKLLNVDIERECLFQDVSFTKVVHVVFIIYVVIAGTILLYVHLFFCVLRRTEAIRYEDDVNLVDHYDI